MFTQHQDGRLTVVPIPKGKNAVLRFLYETLSDFYLPYFLQAQIATFQETVRLREGLADGLAKDMLRMAWDTARRRNQRMTILVANLSQSDRSDLRALCNETGIKYLEIGPEVLATATVDSDLIFGQYDNHWNAKANKLIAAALLRQLRSYCGVELINR
ncbi:MAG: hypothetical protein WAZ97_23665 [Pseudolabrys sp.]